MSIATLKRRLIHLSRDLAAFGFALGGPYRLKRTLPNLDQFIEFQPGHQQLEGLFTCNLAWKITADKIAVQDAYDHILGLGDVAHQGDLWLSHKTKEELDSAFSNVQSLLTEYGIPFLDSLGSLEQLVRSYEAASSNQLEDRTNPLTPILFFGIDEGWRNYNLGFAYMALGNNEQARQYLSNVIDKVSDRPFDWIQERKKVCIQAMESM